jgi:hypothetical protein
MNSLSRKMRTFETMPLSSESSAEDVATELTRIAPEVSVRNDDPIVAVQGRKAEIQRCADALSAAGFHVRPPPWRRRRPDFFWCEVRGRNCCVLLGYWTSVIPFEVVGR